MQKVMMGLGDYRNSSICSNVQSSNVAFQISDWEQIWRQFGRTSLNFVPYYFSSKSFETLFFSEYRDILAKV